MLLIILYERPIPLAYKLPSSYEIYHKEYHHGPELLPTFCQLQGIGYYQQ